MNDQPSRAHDDEWLTLAEIADELRLSPATVRSWIAKGQLHGKRAGRRKWLVQRAELQRMLEDGEPASAFPPPDPLWKGRRPGSRARDLQSPPGSGDVSLRAEEAELDLDDRFTIIEGRWNAALWSSQSAPPDPQFIERIRGIAIAASVRAEILAEYLDEPDYSWKPIRGGKDLTLSHELSPAAHRPGPPEAWDVFDAAVLRLGLAMESESIAEVQAATEALSVTMSQLADVLDERIGPYPWYKLRDAALPQRPDVEPADDSAGAQANVS